MYILELEGDVQVAFIPVRAVSVEDPDIFLEDLRGRWMGLALQALDSRYVAGVGHLKAVLQQAWVAKRRGVARVKFDIDIVMRVACDSRASEALKTVGIKRGFNDLVFIAIGHREEIPPFYDIVSQLGEPSDELLELTGEKEAFLRAHHKIDDVQLDAALVKTDRLAAILAEKAAVDLSGKR